MDGGLILWPSIRSRLTCIPSYYWSRKFLIMSIFIVYLVESESDNTFVCVISDRGFLNNYLKQQPSQTSHLIKHSTPNH